MRIAIRVVSIISILAGLLSLIINEYMLAVILIGLGAYLFLNSKKKPIKTNSVATVNKDPEQPIPISEPLEDKKPLEAAQIKPKNDPIKYSINIAWDNKYEGVKAAIENVKDVYEYERYENMTRAELIETTRDYGLRVYEYPIEEYYDIKFIPEPDNKYNPEALRIVSDTFGMLGYVPDKNLSRVKGMLNKHPDASIWLEIKGGSYKYWDDEEDKIVTEKMEWTSKIRFEYTKK